MSDETKGPVHVIHGTIPPEEWMKFFKQHFKPAPAGKEGEHAIPEAAKTTGSCEEYGCPSSHPISGTKLQSCEVQIVGRKVVSVNCHYEAIKRS